MEGNIQLLQLEEDHVEAHTHRRSPAGLEEEGHKHAWTEVKEEFKNFKKNCPSTSTSECKGKFKYQYWYGLYYAGMWYPAEATCCSTTKKTDCGTAAQKESQKCQLYVHCHIDNYCKDIEYVKTNTKTKTKTGNDHDPLKNNGRDDQTTAPDNSGENNDEVDNDGPDNSGENNDGVDNDGPSESDAEAKVTWGPIELKYSEPNGGAVLVVSDMVNGCDECKNAQAVLGWIAGMRITALFLRYAQVNTGQYVKSKLGMMWRTNMHSWWKVASGKDGDPPAELAAALALFICKKHEGQSRFKEGYQLLLDPSQSEEMLEKLYEKEWDPMDSPPSPSCGQWVTNILIEPKRLENLEEKKDLVGIRDYLFDPTAYGMVPKLDPFPSGPAGRTERFGIRVEFRAMNVLKSVVFDKKLKKYVQPIIEGTISKKLEGHHLTMAECLVEMLEMVRIGQHFANFKEKRGSFSDVSHSFLATGKPNPATRLGNVCKEMDCASTRNAIQNGLLPQTIKKGLATRKDGRQARITRAKNFAKILFGTTDDDELCVNYLTTEKKENKGNLEEEDQVLSEVLVILETDVASLSAGL